MSGNEQTRDDGPVNLAEGLATEIARCAALVERYRSLPGGVGAFGATMIQADVDRAVKAQGSGDLLAMVSAYERLSGAQ